MKLNPMPALVLAALTFIVSGAATTALADLLNYGATGVVQGGGIGPLTKHRASFDFTEFDMKTLTYSKVTDNAQRRELLRYASPITYVTKTALQRCSSTEAKTRLCHLFDRRRASNSL